VMALSGEGSQQDQLQGSMNRLATTRVVDVFRAWDVDGSGALSAAEFAAAMAALGVEPQSPEEAAANFAEFDVNADGKIDYAELRRALSQPRDGSRARARRDAEKAAKGGPSVAGVPPAELRQRAEEKRRRARDGVVAGRRHAAAEEANDATPTLVAQVRAGIAKRMERVIDTFRVFDADKSNSLTRAEFGRAMEALGLQLAEVDEVWATIDSDGSGEVVYHEFLAALAPSLAAAGASDVALDPNSANAFRYNKHDAESAAALIERKEEKMDYEEAQRMRRSAGIPPKHPGRDVR
jgi:Ca2+-binding EF-hand superfamily protein